MADNEKEQGGRDGTDNRLDVSGGQRHLQRALDRRQPLWRKVWHWVRGDA